ncbi:MAG: TetR/AcrR family transcriptional regulator [Ilumatobacter sp.]|uniref:TetR/AcrR family transcriptional regulator n=1 Tax=Ilumatobacter sp. TaxID=1967498 RepID=UPI00260C3516|nr:TetR/AcrR family transcriptional regulator [Ilumatobacter sp.]MDJ0771761.1 TetR/AcrR family transcriptional regulator [Ilumatobacter sp.]
MPRGRTRDELAHQRILDATFELVGAGDPGQVGVNDIAEAAGVAKQTIYRWWPSRTAVILDALVVGTMRATPFRESDDLRADFEAHLRAVIRLFNSPTGALVRELVGESQRDPAIAEEFRERFWAPRRALSIERLRRGVEHGWIRDDLDIETVLDAIYGPLWLRLMIGHRRLRPADARAVVDAIWPGIAVSES